MRHRTIAILLGAGLVAASGCGAAPDEADEATGFASAAVRPATTTEVQSPAVRFPEPVAAFEGAPDDPPYLEAGYSIEPLTEGLDFPTSLASDEQGHFWVSESGVDPDLAPDVKAVSPTGGTHVVLSAADLKAGQLEAPLTSVAYRDGWLWITHRQRGVNDWLVGAISRFRPDDPVRTFATVITNLPAGGDHSVTQIVFDASGRAYFGIGTATNSGVVGVDDDVVTGWLEQLPEFHDFAPKDVTLADNAFRSPNPLTGDPRDVVVTAPFSPFGSGPVTAGTRIAAATQDRPAEGMIAGGGAIYSFDATSVGVPTSFERAFAQPGDAPAGTPALRLEAWGLRNPNGLRFDRGMTGRLYVTNDGADVRSAPPRSLLFPVPAGVSAGAAVPVGSRPLANDEDDLFALDVGGADEFFGWPDWAHLSNGSPASVADPRFCRREAGQRAIRCPTPLFEESFARGLHVEPAVAELSTHVTAGKLDVAPSAFGHEGELFVAESGAFVPTSGATRFGGYAVVRVDPKTGAVRAFLGGRRARAQIFQPDALNEPVDVHFEDGAMYVVDLGEFEPGLGIAAPATGKIWRVTRAVSVPPVTTAE